MSLADEIINGTYGKKKKKSLADSIVNGTYKQEDFFSNDKKKETTVKVEDIAPVKEEKKWYQKILQTPEAFKDGYQFGDVSKTIGGTIGDLGMGAVKGVVGVGENIGQGLSAGIAQVADWTGNDDYAERVRKNIANEKGKILTRGISKGQEAIDKYSFSGSTGDQVSESIGQIASIFATGGVGGSGLATATMFGNAAGGTFSESYKKEDVEDWQVWTKAVGTGLVEAATERLFGIFGKSGLDTGLANAVSNRISSGAGKILSRVGIQATGEAVEEFLSYAGSQGLDTAIDFVNKNTSNNEAKFKEDWNWEEVGEQMAIAFLASGTIGAGVNVNSISNNMKSNNMNLKEAVNETARQQDVAGQSELLTKEIEDLQKEVKKTKDPTKVKELQTELEWKQKQLNSLQSNTPTIPTDTNIQEEEKVEQPNAQQFTEESKQLEMELDKQEAPKTPKQEAEKIVEQIVQEQELKEQETNQVKRQEIQARIDELEAQLEPLQAQIEQENTVNNQDKITSLEALKTEYDNPLIQEAIDNQITKLKQETQEELNPTPASQEIVEQEASQNLQSITDEDIAPTKQNSNQQVMTEEEYLSKNGYPFMGYSESGLHMSRNTISDKVRGRDVKRVMQTAQEYDSKRAELRQEYKQKVESGEIRQPTPIEKALQTARSEFDERSDVQAARRLLEKRGIDWRTETTNGVSEENIPIQSDVGITEDTTDISTRIQETLGLKKKDTTELYEKVSKANSVEETKQILEDYKDINETVQDEEVKEIRRHIRTTKKDVSQFKNSITDYADFYKKYGRKLNIGNGGIPVDTFYQELSSQYPQYFDSNVTNVADQLETIQDFMDNNQAEYTQKVGEISDEDLNKLAEEYYAEVHAKEFNKFTESQGAYKDIDNVIDPEALKEDLSREVKEQVKDIKKELNTLKTQLKEIQAPIKEVVQELKATKIEAPVQEIVQPTQQEIDNLLDIQKNKSGSEYASAFYDLKRKYGDANLYKALNEEKTRAKKGTTAPVEETMQSNAEIEETAPNPFELTDEQNAKIQELRDDTEKWTQVYRERYDDKKFADKRIKGVAMQNSAEIRNVTQGDWLIPIEGGLTETELANKISKLRSNYVGKQVLVDGKEGTITGNSFGKIGVEFTDGTQQYVDKNSIQPLEDIDSIIQEQQKMYEQYNVAPEPQKQAIEQSKTEVQQIAPSTEKVAQNENTDVPETKQRSWVKTSTESEVVNGEIDIEDLDNVTYEVKSNKKTLDVANASLERNGYDKSVEYFNSKLIDKKVSVEDIVLGERLIQEALMKGDKKTAAELIENVSILGTELGQKIQALSIIQKLRPEGQLRVLEKVVNRGKTKGDKAFENVQITQEMKDKILSVVKPDGTYDQLVLNEVVEQVKQEIADQMETTLGDKINAWRYLAMLGNPKTHLRNLISNVAMKGTTAVKNAVARTIEDVAPIKNKTKTWKKPSKDVLEYADRTTLEVKEILNGENSFSEDTSIKSKRKMFETKILEKVYNFNSDMLTKEDWWFKKPAFKSAFAEYLTANGIKTKDDIKNNYKIVEKAKLYAMEQAQIATFSQMSYLANKINEIENKNMAGKVIVGSIMPFKKTPINIAKAGLEYSPLGFAKTLTHDIAQVKKGNMEASQLIDNIAKNTTGSALVLVGYMLAQAGLLSGGGEDDKEGKYDSQLGDMTYSIKIGDTSYSLSWLSPVAMPLFVGANAFEKLVEQKEWNADVVMETLAKTLDPLSEMSFLSGLTGVLSSYETGSMEQIKGMVESIGQNYLTQFVPTLSSQAAATIDDTKRTTTETNASGSKFINTTINKLKYKIPGLRETLEPSLDIWGNEVKQAETVGERAIDNFIAPYSKKKDITTNVDTELKSIYKETGEKSVIPTNSISSTLDYKNEKYKMTNEEYTDFKKKYGQTAYEMLEELFTTNTYAESDSTEKAKLISNVYEYARDISKKEYFDNHDVNYTNTTEDNIPVYKEKSIKNAIEYDMTPEEYSYFEENPSKYKTITAITDFETYKTYSKDLSDIKGDKDRNGKTISNSRKNKVFEYINGLSDLGFEQKVMLAKMEYPSYDEYNYDIIEYLNNDNSIDYDTMESILLELGFKVDANGNINW